MNKIFHGKCEDILQELPPNSVDAFVTDPPYGLAFMGKKWDYQVPTIFQWEQVLRVLKPGGHLLSFGGTRTYHRMAVNIEDAGFEIRDQLQWLYGSGFPKSVDIGKSLDKQNNIDREDKWGGAIDRNIGPTGNKKCDNCGKWLRSSNPCTCDRPQDKPKSVDAKKWEGWGTALKPANEPICLARKPTEGTIAENILLYGTGGLNIDTSRIAIDEKLDQPQLRTINRNKKESQQGWGMNKTDADRPEVISLKGRFPANVLLDEQAAVLLDEQSGQLTSAPMNAIAKAKDKHIYGAMKERPAFSVGDSGGASRFFYVAKASKAERNDLMPDMPLRDTGIKNDSGRGFSQSDPYKTVQNQNFHTTVKPIELMQYLIKLVTPPGGTVCDPFCGSGSTLVAAAMLNFNWIGIEKEAEYVEITKSRLNNYVGLFYNL